MKVLGGLIIALGAFIWLGNVFHFFPTFPLLGYVTMVIGGAIMKKGAKPA
jgi:hypothetical protein